MVPRHMFTEGRIEYEIEYSGGIMDGCCGVRDRKIVDECYSSHWL